MSGTAPFIGSSPTSATLMRINDAALAQSPKPTLNSIERNYQVAEEATRDWSPKLFGSIPVGEIGGKRNLTITEGKLLDNLTRDRGILGLQKFQAIHDDALATSKSRSVPPTTIPANVEAKISELPTKALQVQARRAWPTNDGHTDAFRHAYWNARLTSEFGAEWTTQFATAHEGNNPGNSTREAMDLYNNQVGRQIAINNPNASPSELADLVKKALDNGDLVVVNSKGHLDWSNKVAVGHHSISIQLDNIHNAINTPAGSASVR
jgi:hypothetical protein